MSFAELDLLGKEYLLEKEDKINLARGDPNFTTPKFVIEAAYDAMNAGFTHYLYRYGTEKGLPELQEAACSYYSKYNVKYEPSNVLVTCGSGLMLSLLFENYFSKGGDIILTNPAYAGYFRDLKHYNAKISYAPFIADEKNRLDVEKLEKSITKDTKLIVICNPLNPTGKVFTEKELREVANISLKYNIDVLSDEIYNEYVWGDNKHFAITSIDGMKEKTIVVQSFSKTFSMTGWRLGYIFASNDNIKKISSLPFFAAAPTFIQRAGAAALRSLYCHDSNAPRHLDLWRKEFLRRLRHLHKIINETNGLECTFPDATYYLWVKSKQSEMTNEKFVKLFQDKGVLVDPGVKYGPSWEKYVRIGMVQPYNYVEEAGRRIKEIFK